MNKPVRYKALSILPSGSVFEIESCVELEKIGLLFNDGLLFLKIDNIRCGNKKIAILNASMLRSLNIMNRQTFNESTSDAIGRILLESRNLYVLDENGSKWN